MITGPYWYIVYRAFRIPMRKWKGTELSALKVECYAIGLDDTSLLSSRYHAVVDDPCNLIDLICSTVQSAASFYTRRIR